MRRPRIRGRSFQLSYLGTFESNGETSDACGREGICDLPCQTAPLTNDTPAARWSRCAGRAIAKVVHLGQPAIDVLTGIWLGDEDVREMTIFSHSNEITISLLIYPDDMPDKRWANELDEPKEWDTYDQFVVGNHGSSR